MPIFNQFFEFSLRTIEMLESGPQIAVKKGSHFFTMVTVGRSRAECLPAKHEAICEIPQRGKLNLIPTAQSPIKKYIGLVSK